MIRTLVCRLLGPRSYLSTSGVWVWLGKFTTFSDTFHLNNKGLWTGASLVPQTVKNPPAMQEIWVGSLGWADPLEEGMTTHSSILAWRIPWTEEPGRLQSMGWQSRTRLSDQAQHSTWTNHTLRVHNHVHHPSSSSATSWFSWHFFPRKLTPDK